MRRPPLVPQVGNLDLEKTNYDRTQLIRPDYLAMTGGGNQEKSVVDVEPQPNAREAGPPTMPIDAAPTVPFSAFTEREKRGLRAMIGLAGFFSSIAATIYFPAIPLIAYDFNVSISLINLTVTVYLVFQGLSPVLWAPFADSRGRRPIYILCLSLLCLSSLALALTPTSKWWLLLIFRCFQASGGAPTAVLGSGVVADIATPAERGRFTGWAGFGTLFGYCIGPVVGGLLAGTLGWRWIFWFVCILTVACLTFMVLFFPETLRLIVGNGSIPAPKWNRPLVPTNGPQTRTTIKSRHVVRPASRSKSRINPLRFFLEPDIDCLLLANGIVYMAFITIQATTSLILERNYPFLTQMKIGLCFLPIGAGCITGSIFTGRLLDWQYRQDRAKWEVERRQIRQEQGVANQVAPWTEEEEGTFRIEFARVRWALLFTVLGVLVTIAYGWTLDHHVNLAVPLIFQFMAGYLILAQMTSCQTLLVDTFPKEGSFITSLNNFVRCSLGALISAVINLILDALGIGWTYTLIGGIILMFSPALTVVVIYMGPNWRQARMARSRA